MNVLDLFSGIGGFSLGLERAGMRTVAFCEIEPFCRRILAKHWPGVPIYDDVRSLTADRLRADGIAPDVICGGFPCQDISTAGEQAGIDASRSGLWSEIVRLSGELRPRYVIVENVTNLLAGPTDKPGHWFGRVLGDLAALRFDAEWHCIPASAVGASHQRDRVWIVAYPANAIRRPLGRCMDSGEGSRRPQEAHRPVREGLRDTEHGGPATRGSDVSYADCFAPIGAAIARQERPTWCPEPEMGRVVDDVSYSMVEPELRALGNAVVPQIPEIIGRAILEAEAQP